MSGRFSKALVASKIQRHIDAALVLARANGCRLDPSNGFVQVLGCGEEANREYGAYRVLLDLAEDLCLDVRAEEPTSPRTSATTTNRRDGRDA